VVTSKNLGYSLEMIDRACKKSKSIISLILSCCLLGSCSSFDLIPSDSVIHRVKGRGPILVSEENPFLAANILLQQESKKHKELAGFLAEAGSPQAISVKQELFETARMSFFYKENLRQYDLELLGGIWVIDGPKAIADEEVKTLLVSQSSSGLLRDPIKTTKKVPDNKTNTTNLLNSSEDINNTANSNEMVPFIEDKEAAIQTEKPLEKASSPKTARESEGQEIFDLNAETSPKNTEEESKEMSEPTTETEDFSNPQAVNFDTNIKALAESTPRGDIVHYISSDNETLAAISAWYTGTEATLSRVAKANSLTPSDKLSAGDQIIIPAELVKNKYIPSSADLNN
jgi:hypothetical protein